MSTHLKPVASLSVRVPRKQGKSNTKIDLFSVSDFEVNYTTQCRSDFYPKVPLGFEDNQLYWISAMYRLRINGRWFCPKARYSFFRLTKIAELVNEAMQND